MKKIFKFIIVLILLALIAICGYTAWSWFSLEDMPPPKEEITIGTKTVSPTGVECSVPILGGIITRNLQWQIELSDLPKQTLNTYELPIILPNMYLNTIKITTPKAEIFKGSFDEYSNFAFTENGNYNIDIILTTLNTDNNIYKSFHFVNDIVIDVPPPPPPKPEVKVSSNSVIQGDSVSIELLNVPENETPTAETDLSLTTFVPLGIGHFIGYTGVSDACDTGEYTIKVKFGDFENIIPITVTKANFNRQDLQIDTSNPSISQASSSAAYKQFRDTIYPFYKTADSKLYWSGKFIQPVEGRLSSEYGLLRYTNGSTKPRRHAGIDLAVSEGTPIKAPAAGRVVFSDYLLNTGNTLVIEHGGGLKSYYFHLNARKVVTDEMVEAGQIIGNVGTTGYSTGPHLHFELRIGNQNLDPFKFFNGTSGCFAFKDSLQN